MSTPSAGGAAIVAEASAAVSARPDAEQLTFLPPGVDDSERGRELAAIVERDRGGRPPGAQNKATQEIKDLCRRAFGDPMLEDFRLAMHTPESLAKYLACDKLEAARLLVDIRKDLRRYFYAPMAAVDGAGRAVTPFTMLIGGREVHVQAGEEPWRYLENEQQNQGFSASPPAVSHDPVSHGGNK